MISQSNLNIIGQIVSAIGMLHIFPSAEKAGEFLTQLLSAIPGCTSAGFCFRQSPAFIGSLRDGCCDTCVAHHGDIHDADRYVCKLGEGGGMRSYPLETVNQMYGHMILAVEKNDTFVLYDPFVRNLGNALTISLENRWQKQKLQDAIELMEQRIVARTAELHESENRLLMAQEIGKTGSWMYTIETNTYWGTAEAHRIFGYPAIAGDIFNDNIRTCIEDPERVHASLLALIGEGREYNIEYAVHPADGSASKVVLSIAKLEKDAQGKPEKVFGFIQDITERKKREQALARSETLLRTTQQLTRVGGWEWNLTTQLMYWSKETYLLHDFEPDGLASTAHELISRSAECYLPEDRPIVLGAFERCVKEGQPYDLEFRFTSCKGRRMWIRTQGEPVLDNGKIIRVVGIIMDITERKRVEEILQQANTYHRSLLEASIDPLVTIGEDGRITDLNHATEMVTGVSRDVLVGSDFSEYFTDPDKARTGFRQAFQNGTVRDYPLEIQHRDGHLTPVIYNASLYRDANGNPAGVFAAARDITERKRAEAFLRDAQRRESIGVLTAGIAHDYNNLLGIMMGNVSLAQMHVPKNNAGLKNLERALSAMERAAELTKQMLAYSGKGKFQLCQVDIGVLVQEHSSLFKVSLSKNVKLITHLPSTQVLVNGDPGQIEQIIMNLLINNGEAIGEKQGIVSITLSEAVLGDDDLTPYALLTNTPLSEGPYACLDVTDNGVGMSVDTMTKMFDPFFTTKFTGRGLGLSAVLGIVQGHKGGISVNSTEGEGTSVRLILPAVPAAAFSAEAESKPTEPAAESRKTILVVDDEEDIATMAQEILETEEYNALVELSPVRAVELYKQRHSEIGLVLLDLTMPEMSGKEVVIALQAIHPAVKIIITSGYSAEDAGKKLGTTQVSGFIQKPYRLQSLLTMVENVMSESA